MNEATVNLKIPANIYEHARLIANERNCSPESLLLNGLAALFSPAPAEIGGTDNLDTLEDNQLWSIVYQRPTPQQEARGRELALRGNQGIITEDETIELEAWGALVDCQMLLRSRALLLLHRRGHDIGYYLDSVV